MRQNMMDGTTLRLVCKLRTSTIINENFLISVKSQSTENLTRGGTPLYSTIVAFNTSHAQITWEACPLVIDKQHLRVAYSHLSQNQGLKVVVVLETSRYITSAATLARLLNPTSNPLYPPIYLMRLVSDSGSDPKFYYKSR